MASLTLEPEYLTPTEAAVVSDVAVRDVNRVFDEHILPDDFLLAGERRCLRAEACILINFYFHTADAFTSETRSHVIDLILKRGELERTFKTWLLVEFKTPHHSSKIKHWNIEEKFFTVNFDRFFETTTKRYTSLIEARKAVVEDAEILGGTPVIRGTRVPVYDVAASLDKGISKERILLAYPSLDERAIDLAKIYADAKPLRGRPREPAKPTKRAMIVRSARPVRK
jgi:uncharacterized protein (DUF433 family)